MNRENFCPHSHPEPSAAAGCRARAAGAVKAALGEAVRRVCRRRNITREQLLDLINEDLPAEERISLRRLNFWLAGDPRYTPRADVLPLLTAKLGPDALRSLAELCGLRLVSESDAAVIPLGRQAQRLLAQHFQPEQAA